MASAFNPNIGDTFLDCLSVCTQATNTQAPASVWPSVSGSSSSITAGSGSNLSPGAGPDSYSPSRSNSTAQKRPQILIVEDSRADVFLIRESLCEAQVDADLHIVQDGEKAVHFFEQVDQDPSASVADIVILDINLPKRTGHEVLQQMRRSERSQNALVIVVTSSNSERDHEEMTKLGVAAYFCKPSEYQKFMKLGELAKGLLARGRD